MPLYHLVSAIDPLVESDIKQRVNDGLPETLPEWINYNGLTHFKIKLDGDDLKWDSERVLSVDRVVTETEEKRGVTGWVYSLDFNERCPNVEYLSISSLGETEVGRRITIASNTSSSRLPAI